MMEEGKAQAVGLNKEKGQHLEPDSPGQQTQQLQEDLPRLVGILLANGR